MSQLCLKTCIPTDTLKKNLTGRVRTTTTTKEIGIESMSRNWSFIFFASFGKFSNGKVNGSVLNLILSCSFVIRKMAVSYGFVFKQVAHSYQLSILFRANAQKVVLLRFTSTFYLHNSSFEMTTFDLSWYWILFLPEMPVYIEMSYHEQPLFLF